MKIIFLGPPGSGKGTYSKRVSPALNIPHISTGDIFRDHLKNETEIGKKVKQIMDSGGLVSDEIVMEIVKLRIEKDDTKNGFIFDGFPRTLEQARQLDDITKIDVVLNLVIPENILIEKLTARRTCEKCGNIYNIADINREGITMPPMLPEKEGICDKCGGKLIQRTDDNEETIRDRLEEYKKQTEPLISYYRKKGLLLDINIHAAPETMVPEILEKLKNIEIK